MTGKKEVVVKKMPVISGNFNDEISEYFASKKEVQAVITHYPEWDAVGGEPSLELARVRRELLSADQQLEAKRQDYRERRELAEVQWRELRERQLQLRQAFLQFNSFVRENREKRERAQRKIDNERQLQAVREAEIIELQKNLEYLEKVRDNMKSYVEEYRPFQTYLEQVLETKEFRSIAGIFNRYEALIAARQALEEHQDDNLQTLEATSAQLQKMTEEKSQNLLDLNSRLAQLQSRHEQARAKALHWERMVSRIKEVTSRKELEETQVRACIWNLYRQICRRKGVPVEAHREELEKQLHHVKSTIIELGNIVHAAKRKTARERNTNKFPKSRDEAKTESAENTVEARASQARGSGISSYEDSRSIRRN